MKSRHTFSLLAGIALSASAFAASAQAADVSMPASDLWNGFYLGAQAGYLQGTGSNTDLCINTSTGESGCLGNGGLGGPSGFNLGDNNMDGVTAGGYLGYNYRMDQVVLGLEGDFNWDNANDNNSVLGELNYETSLNWDASVRARIGFVVDERALLYVTGGPSWINAQLDSNICGLIGGGAASVHCGDSNTEFGWQLGAGAEYAITDHLSVKAEYLHGWYGNADLDLLKASEGGDYVKYQIKQDLQTNVIRAGIAYHFGGL